MVIIGIVVLLSSDSYLIVLILPVMILWSLACFGLVIASLFSGKKWLWYGLVGLFPLIMFSLYAAWHDFA